MRKILFVLALFGLLVMPAFAGGNSPVTTQNLAPHDGSAEGAWVVSFPTGTFDYFNIRMDHASVEPLSIAGKPYQGMSVCEKDNAQLFNYDLVGLFAANLGLDPAGNTPNLGSGVSAVPAGLAQGIWGDFNYTSLGAGATLTVGADPQHLVVKLPTGDNGSLGVGADSTNLAGPNHFSGWTSNGYSTTANDITTVGGPWCMSLNVDANADLAPGPAGRLLLTPRSSDEVGDYYQTTTQYTKEFGIAFFHSHVGALFWIWISFAGLPVLPVGGILPTFPTGPAPANGGFFRLGLPSWPYGFGNSSINLVALSGVLGLKGSAHVSAEVTLNILPDPAVNPWGIRDDGAYETSWVVSATNGTADWFNVNFNDPLALLPTNIIDFKVAIANGVPGVSGSPSGAWPATGVYPANKVLDASGNTPDLGNPYEQASMLMSTNTVQYTAGVADVRTFGAAIPYATVTDNNVHGALWHAPGEFDPPRAGVMADSSSSFITGASGWTQNAYTTPANLFTLANWSIRLGSN